MINLDAIPIGNSIQGFIGTKACAIAARVVKDQILHLTSQGLDYNGIPFAKVSEYGRPLAAYSHSYERRRKSYGLRIDIRNLSFTNIMLSSIHYIPYDESGVLTMPDEQVAIAEYNEARGDVFFNASEETIELAYQEIEREFEAELEGWISNE